MRLQKILAVCALALLVGLAPATGLAAVATTENSAIKSEGGSGATEGISNDDQALDYYKNAGYLYTSKRYGYSIVCPTKPAGVIPASMLEENGGRGDVLIFDNQEYYINNAWLVLVDVFTDEEIPPNLGKKSEAEQQAYIDNLMNTAGYEFVRLCELNGSMGVYAVPAKEIEVDTNGDGKPDETLVSETQMIKTYFRGQFGGRFSIQLIDNPELTEKNVTLYRLGLLTFQEWPSVVAEDGSVRTRAEDDKAARKQEQQKKDKKDKQK